MVFIAKPNGGCGAGAGVDLHHTPWIATFSRAVGVMRALDFKDPSALAEVSTCGGAWLARSVDSASRQPLLLTLWDALGTTSCEHCTYCELLMVIQVTAIALAVVLNQPCGCSKYSGWPPKRIRKAVGKLLFMPSEARGYHAVPSSPIYGASPSAHQN